MKPENRMGRGMGGGLFENFFGMGGMGGGMGREEDGPTKTESVKRALQVTLEDVYCGKVRKIRVTRKRICKDCNGKGATKAGAVQKCSDCNGKGQVMITQQMGPGFMSRRVSTCTRCQGEGTMVDPKFRCKACNGECVVEEKKTLEVHIDPGMKTNQKIEFEGEADERPGMKPGDIIFVLQVVEHKKFKVSGVDLEITEKINLTEALCGVEFLVKHLDGRTIHVKSKKLAVIKPGCVKMIKGEGMPKYKSPYDKGNLLIKFEVEFPKTIPQNIQEKLLAMLPPKQGVNLQEKEKSDVEVKELEEPEVTSKEEHGHPGNAYDEDDEHEGHRGMGGDGQYVSCSLS